MALTKDVRYCKCQPLRKHFRPFAMEGKSKVCILCLGVILDAEETLSQIKEILDVNPCHHRSLDDEDPDCVLCDVRQALQTYVVTK